MQNFGGPVYCETPVGVLEAAFPAELWNTYSNLAIIFFGIAGLILTTRRAPRAADLYILCLLLIVNGVGSFLWHGTRLRWALTLDVTPGLIFLLALVFFWARRVWNGWIAGAFLGSFFFAVQYLRGTGFGYGRWASMAPAIILFGALLILRTVSMSRMAALYGTTAIASAMLALTFRTIDGDMCATIPFGTHFLWHIFLSAGAFMGIMALITLARAAERRKTAIPAEAPAE
jgi:hypothetical protein